jgi:quercetin dioxygenase-like cupin family protein
MAVELDVGHAVVLAPGEGETISDRDRRSLLIKAAREEVTVTESRYARGEQGPDPHVHRRHSDSFYVLSGQLVFRVGPGLEPVRAAAGTFVLVPPGVVHTFANEDSDSATFLNIHTPDCGFAESLRARRDGREPEIELDSYDPPADGGLPAADVIALASGEGERIGGLTIAAARPELSMLELDARRGANVSLHHHRRHSDAFYVLDGEVEFDVAGETSMLGVGGFMLAPAGVVHGFSSRGMRVLNLHAPGGFAEYQRELAALRAAGAEPDDAFYDRHDVYG